MICFEKTKNLIYRAGHDKSDFPFIRNHSVRYNLIWRGEEGTGNREQGTGMAAAAWIMKSYMLYMRHPFRMNAIVVPVSP